MTMKMQFNHVLVFKLTILFPCAGDSENQVYLHKCSFVKLTRFNEQVNNVDRWSPHGVSDTSSI